MWRDFSPGTGETVPARLEFGYPEPAPLPWIQLWHAVVRQVSVTPDKASKAALLDRFVRGPGVRTLGFANAHAMNTCVTDSGFAADLLALDHIVRDGIGVHALYRMIGARSGLNLNGTDLLPELMARFAGQRIALFGTRLHLVERAGDRLRRELRCDVIMADGFQLDGYYLERVARERPALVVLGMGMPKQERVARLMKHGLHQDVAVVCGGAILDFLSGHKPRAPLWMRRTGLEWAYRLSLEPKRLFGRYVVGNPLFLLRSAILASVPARVASKPRAQPLPPSDPAPFGIGGPLAGFAFADDAAPPVRSIAAAPPAVPPLATPALIATVPRPSVVPFGTAISEFSANRPVVARDDLFGRQHDLDRLLAWVLDHSGNALIYGPRGYGKTSLVRVFGEIADSRAHVVLYASCSRQVDFGALMRLYLNEIPDDGSGAALLPAEGPLSVQQVATRLAAVRGMSLVIILDEFDRIERDDTRESIVELVKDVSDLTAAVRFVLVGVATDATAILGYHPSVHRCITCVPLTRLAPEAIDELFRRKAVADRLGVPESVRRRVVALSAGSAYHAQLIGQKLVSHARLGNDYAVTGEELDRVVGEIVTDAGLMDARFARLASEFRAAPALRGQLLSLAQRALADPRDLVQIGDGSDASAALCRRLAADGVLQPVDDAAYRFANAFLPQLVLMLDHLIATRMAA